MGLGIKESTDSQIKVLKEFKTIIADILNIMPNQYTDTELLKFLQSKNFSLKKTEKTFRTVHMNKTLFFVYDMNNWYKKPEVAEKFETTNFLGFAKDGTGIRYIAAGRLDLYGFIMSMSCSELCHYFSYIMEEDLQRIKEESSKRGTNINEVTYIIDMEGFTLNKVLHKNVLEMGLDFVYIMQYYYPLMWKNVLLINVPSVFGKAFNLFKPVMTSGILDRLKMASKDNSRELLLQYIDEDILPVSLGGTLVDSKGDPECKEFMSYGGTVPENFYAQYRQALLSSSDSGVETLLVGPRSTAIKHVVIDVPGSIIQWQHRTESGSVLIAIYFKELGIKPIEEELEEAEHCIDCGRDNCNFKQVSVSIRSQLHCVQDNLKMYCPSAGLYLVKYGNSGSFFTSRKVYLRFSVLPPKSP